jgi:hypothetical protein
MLRIRVAAMRGAVTRLPRAIQGPSADAMKTNLEEAGAPAGTAKVRAMVNISLQNQAISLLGRTPAAAAAVFSSNRHRPMV